MMTDEQAKSLGLCALALGMPWVEGLLNGDDYTRIPSVCYTPNEWAWPDFRDPLTEAWLVAWALDLFARRAWSVHELPGHESLELGMGLSWRLLLNHSEMSIETQAPTRAEAWVTALEKLKGEG